jgi:predicted glycosyltransferase involved in capsule biosynthesis
MAKLSFLVTYRDRKPMLDGFLKSILGFYPTAEVVVVEQRNDKPFLQGQLLNLAFQRSHRDIVVLMDVDIRLREFVDFPACMNLIQHPFVAYDRIWNCDSKGRALAERRGVNGCYGGCCVFTRKQFEASCGYSNLIVGWGGDDTILNRRAGEMKRLTNTVLHITHECRKETTAYIRNAWLCETESRRRKDEDGLRQTIGNVVEEGRDGSVSWYSFDQIGVPLDFKYWSLLQESLP